MISVRFCILTSSQTLRRLSPWVAGISLARFHAKSPYGVYSTSLVAGIHSYFFIVLSQSSDCLVEAGGEIDSYPVLSSSPGSFCTFLFIKEPVAIGTWKVAIIVSIGI